MPMAMINARLDAGLKERVDPKVQQMGYSPPPDHHCALSVYQSA